jgi:hypothetical protein
MKKYSTEFSKSKLVESRCRKQGIKIVKTKSTKIEDSSKDWVKTSGSLNILDISLGDYLILREIKRYGTMTYFMLRGNLGGRFSEKSWDKLTKKKIIRPSSVDSVDYFIDADYHILTHTFRYILGLSEI